MIAVLQRKVHTSTNYVGAVPENQQVLHKCRRNFDAFFSALDQTYANLFPYTSLDDT